MTLRNMVHMAMLNDYVDVVKDLLPDFDDDVKQDKEGIIRTVLFWVLTKEHYDMLEFLCEEGWRVDLDFHLRLAINDCNTELMDTLCRLGAGPVRVPWFNYWPDASHDWAKCFGVLAAHNLLTQKVYLCCKKDDSLLGILKRTGLVLLLDLSGDSCSRIVSRGRIDYYATIEEDELKIKVADLVEQFVENGASVEIETELQERLPAAGPHLSEILRVALQPPSLTSLCRKTVRRAAPERCYQKFVRRLGLPEPLAKYLCPPPLDRYGNGPRE